MFTKRVPAVFIVAALAAAGSLHAQTFTAGNIAKFFNSSGTLDSGAGEVLVLLSLQ